MYLYRYKYVLSYNEKVIAYITYIPEQISYRDRPIGGIHPLQTL